MCAESQQHFKATFKLPFDNIEKSIRAIEKGLPYSTIHKLQSVLSLTNHELSDIANVAPRTLLRRKTQGRLTSSESEKVFLIAKLFNRAEEIFGSKERAKLWMKLSQPALGGKTPLKYSKTVVGAQAVEDLLGQIEHGVVL
ncbi:MAG: DUF2384 domain-containing protein [Candidatus Hinthialibacter antarcticus]|nr:DUF2384 domain-containing protein [Candidatus Hinthialibacter antarcticus]